MKHIDNLVSKTILNIGLFFFLSINLPCFAQSSTDTIAKPAIKLFPTWETGVFFGIGLIYGDLTSDVDVIAGASQPGYGLWAVRNLTPNWAIRLNLFHTKLKANDLDAKLADHRARGFSHETPLTEISFLAQWDLRGKRRYKRIASFKKTVSPYLFAGFAGGIGTPEVFYDDQKDSPLVLEDKKNTSGFRIGIPFGGGLKIDLSQRSFVGFEFGLRPTFGDLLDGVSKSGNEDKNDWYAFGGMTIGYRFATDDADGDGVVDAKDKCPGVAGEKRFRGCPDTDGDGVRDNDDDCPLIAGAKTMNGCPDSDLDGVADAEDECPNTKGMRRLQGCPDADWDNVIDKNDACPNTPGLAEFKGCPDTDLDGVMDLEDKCPDIAGQIKFQGCPEGEIIENEIVKESDSEENTEIVEVKDSIINELQKSVVEMSNLKETLEENHGGVKENTSKTNQQPNDSPVKNIPPPTFEMIRFATSSNELSNKDKQILENIAATLPNFPDYQLRIAGYTDNVGNMDLNLQLSKKRAKACYDYLKSIGADTSQMTYTGFGEMNPISSNESAIGRANNRRVVITLKKKNQ